ncbi:MAG TPA: VTT domain-containing protein, partial [Candidatus Binatia bacterium]|nr:VTT domain-containing protein [Candidatus Binatia bacterium]
AAVVLLLLAMTAAWRWTPLAEQIDIRKIIGWSVSLRHNPARHAIILAAYIVGSLVSFPVLLLILATAFVFGPLAGTAYSFAGCMLGAAVTYGVGYFMGKDFVRRLVGEKWRKIEKTIGQTGVLAIAAMRLLPVAPFTIVNVLSGAFRVPVWNYFAGSLLGLAPGILVINFFARQFARAVREPGPASYVLLALAVLLTVVGTIWLKRKVAKTA